MRNKAWMGLKLEAMAGTVPKAKVEGNVFCPEIHTLAQGFWK